MNREGISQVTCRSLKVKRVVRQSRIEPFNRIPVMRKLVLLDLAGPRVQDCHLLLARVQIASNERHARASFR
jgi:hypothetical protein